MLLYVRHIRMGLAAVLVLGTFAPIMIFTFDGSATSDSGSMFPSTGTKAMCDHGLCPDENNKGSSSVDNEKSVVATVGADLGVPQIIGDMAGKVVQRVEKARKYFHETVLVEPRYEKVRAVCRNFNEQCALWAAQGQCHKNHIYMKPNCAPVCFSCAELHPEAKCPIDPNTMNAWSPGDLNRMFERLTTDPSFEQYSPQVLSRPSFAGKDTNETADYQLGPWVLLLEDFVSAEEAVRIIHNGADVGYKRSREVAAKASTRRTSTNAWCNNYCKEDPVVVGVVNRIETLTKIPHNNSENLQLLRYEEGQFYKIHNDYIAHERARFQGVRLLTVFLYLSDVEEGGGTNFPKLDLTVEPKRGRALIWPSVLDEDPHEIDQRTDHQALPVVKGLKYGANAWLYQRDMQAAKVLGCNTVAGKSV
jgi:prolyl 4-hydroxylase